jgi:uncharacterized membrane protein YebE (DUF533 family)
MSGPSLWKESRGHRTPGKKVGRSAGTGARRHAVSARAEGAGGASAALLMTEKSFRRIGGYRKLWMLRAALGQSEV